MLKYRRVEVKCRFYECGSVSEVSVASIVSLGCLSRVELWPDVIFIYTQYVVCGVRKVPEREVEQCFSFDPVGLEDFFIFP